MRRLILALTFIAATAAIPLMAQETPSAKAPAASQARGGQAGAPSAPAASRAPSLHIPGVSPVSSATNIKLDLALTDNYTGAVVTKNVSLLMLQGNGGMIRTGNGFANLNVDAVAAAYQNGMVSVKLTFEYLAAQPKDGPLAGARVPTLNESITIVLQDGKPLLVSQSADPTTDRKVTVEVTATILK